MTEGPLRGLFDPLAALLAAKVRYRDLPASTYTPPPTQAVPNPAPVAVPARTEVYVDPASLPVQVLNGGAVDVAALVAMVQDAVRQATVREIRIVHGAVTFATSQVWPAGSSRDVAVAWESAPLAPVSGALVRLDVGAAWQGRVSAVLKSVDSTGAVVTVSVLGAAPVALTSALPLTVHADGLYLYSPPYTP